MLLAQDGACKPTPGQVPQGSKTNAPAGTKVTVMALSYRVFITSAKVIR